MVDIQQRLVPALCHLTLQRLLTLDSEVMATRKALTSPEWKVTHRAATIKLEKGQLVSPAHTSDRSSIPVTLCCIMRHLQSTTEAMVTNLMRFARLDRATIAAELVARVCALLCHFPLRTCRLPTMHGDQATSLV